jgi:tRNA-2-methylthio-N6-dimethylallyladenosine synthase
MTGRFFLETYGCQMNIAESNAMTLQLEALGWSAAERPEEADIVLLNTCAVRQTAEDRIWGRIGYYKFLKESRDFTLIVTGCMAERLGEEIIKESKAVDYVLGTFQKRKLSEIACGHGETHAPVKADDLSVSPHFQFEPYHLAKGAFKAFLPIMHGCNNFCSYCIVPYVRGREISRSPEDIFREIERLEEKGVREITLLGQNVNSYNWNDTLRFPELLAKIASMTDSIRWIRFMSSHPKDIPQELIRVIAEHETVCNHIHLPVQHGSNSVLRRMNRKYTREHYFDLVEMMRSVIPGLSLSTDLMIGFPGESEEDFELTLDLVRQVGFDDAFTYYYNPREGTAAYDMAEQVPHEVKLDRLKTLIELQREISFARRKARIGDSERVLVEQRAKKREGELLARTNRNEMVAFPGGEGLIGSFVPVVLKTLHGNTFRGEVVCPGK